MLRSGTYLQDRYEILESIGSGGMADVYKAQCHKLNRLVAIKVLKPEFSSDEGFVQKFKMEAQAAAGLSHPNIVNIYDVVDEGQLHYIVMELIEGITLKSYIAKKGKLEIREAVGIAIQVAQGLSAAHENNLIHRDIKPQNIIISKDGKAKVADFGIARAATSQTIGSTAMGTVHYISPEQAKGGFSDARSDIYSLGITMYEMVTGRVPFEGDNTVTVAMAHLEEPITRPSLYNPEVPKSLESIILKCTEKRPEDRYTSADEVIVDLRRVLLRPDEETLFASRTEARRKEFIYRSHLTGEQASSKIEKLMTSAGIFVAILIVAILVFVFSQLGRIFRGNPNGGSDSIQAQTVISNDAHETLSDTEIYAPDVYGLPLELAEAKLLDSTLVLRVAGYEDSDTVGKNCVISQNPVAGSIVSKYTSVDVVLSNGNGMTDLSQMGLMNMEVPAAVTYLRDKGFSVEQKDEFSDRVTEGKLIRYEPQSVKAGETVTLYVSAGPLSAMRTVPDLENLTEEEARQRLADAQLQVGEVKKEYSDTVERGRILRQDQEANSMVKADTPVSYVVSQGTEREAWVASLHETYDLSKHFGPGALGSDARIMVRLVQHLDGETVTKTLVEPHMVTEIGRYTLDLPRIEGEPGMETGTVEIVELSTGEILQSYDVYFRKVEQSGE